MERLSLTRLPPTHRKLRASTERDILPQSHLGGKVPHEAVAGVLSLTDAFFGGGDPSRHGRCKVFSVLLSRWDHSRSSKGEGAQELSRIEVTEFEYDTMRRVLEYIYTDRTALDWVCAVEVLRAADIYGLDRLKQMCEDLIIQV